MIARGIVSLADDSTKLQIVQVDIKADETLESVEHFQPAGLTTVPVEGNDAECLLLAVGGLRNHTIALCVQDRTKRPKDLSPGEVALYRMDDGVKRVLLKADDTLELGNAPTEFVALSNLVESELSKIDTELDKIETTLDSLTGQASFGTPYVNAYNSGDVSAAEVKAK